MFRWKNNNIVFIKRIIKIKVTIIIRYGALKKFLNFFYKIMKKTINNYTIKIG